jgi:hypothetical protein
MPIDACCHARTARTRRWSRQFVRRSRTFHSRLVWLPTISIPFAQPARASDNVTQPPQQCHTHRRTPRPIARTRARPDTCTLAVKMHYQAHRRPHKQARPIFLCPYGVLIQRTPVTSKPFYSPSKLVYLCVNLQVQHGSEMLGRLNPRLLLRTEWTFR